MLMAGEGYNSSTSSKLYSALALLVCHLYTTFVDPVLIYSLVACWLITMDKKPQRNCMMYNC